MKYHIILLILLVWLCPLYQSHAACPEFDPIPLSDSVPVGNLQAEEGEALYFSINSHGPGFDLLITTSGGEGDLDMYVLEGELPTKGLFDQASENFSTAEEVRIVDPKEGTYFILLYAYGSFSDVSVIASHVTPMEIPQLSFGGPVENLSAVQGQVLDFKIEADGFSDIAINTIGDTGDLDLFVKRGGLPNLGYKDDWSQNEGVTEEVILHRPEAGTYYLTVVCYTDIFDVALTASTSPLTSIPQLSDGGFASNLSGPEDEKLFFVIDSPGDGRDITISTSGLGDLDLFVREGKPPDVFNFDYWSENFDSNEEVLIQSPPPDTRYYILLYGYSDFSNVILQTNYTASLEPVQTLNNSPVLNLGAAQDSYSYFLVNVPPGQCNLTVTTTGGTGDLDLYIREGGFPTELLSDEFSQNETADEQVVIPRPESGTYYILLYGFEAYSGVTLSASTTPDPNPSPWTYAVTYPNGWSYLPWFGYFSQFEQDWIYHAEHGFQFFSATDSSSYIFYGLNIGSWFWSSDTAYPGMYKFGSNSGWYSYQTGGQPGSRLFTRLSDGITVKESDL